MIDIYKGIRDFRYIMSCLKGFEEYPIWKQLAMGINRRHMWMTVELPTELIELEDEKVEAEYVARAIQPINDGMLGMGITREDFKVKIQRIEKGGSVYSFIRISPKINIKTINVIAWAVFITAVMVAQARFHFFTNLF